MDFKTIEKETKLSLGSIFDPERDIFTKETIRDYINEFLDCYNEEFNNVEQNSDLIDDFCKYLCTVEKISAENVSLETSYEILERLGILEGNKAWFFHMLSDDCQIKHKVAKELSKAISKVLNRFTAYENGEHVEISREEVIKLWMDSSAIQTPF